MLRRNFYVLFNLFSLKNMADWLLILWFEMVYQLPKCFAFLNWNTKLSTFFKIFAIKFRCLKALKQFWSFGWWSISFLQVPYNSLKFDPSLKVFLRTIWRLMMFVFICGLTACWSVARETNVVKFPFLPSWFFRNDDRCSIYIKLFNVRPIYQVEKLFFFYMGVAVVWKETGNIKFKRESSPHGNKNRAHATLLLRIIPTWSSLTQFYLLILWQARITFVAPQCGNNCEVKYLSVSQYRKVWEVIYNFVSQCRNLCELNYNFVSKGRKFSDLN